MEADFYCSSVGQSPADTHAEAANLLDHLGGSGLRHRNGGPVVICLEGRRGGYMFLSMRKNHNLNCGFVLSRNEIRSTRIYDRKNNIND